MTLKKLFPKSTHGGLDSKIDYYNGKRIPSEMEQSQCAPYVQGDPYADMVHNFIGMRDIKRV